MEKKIKCFMPFSDYEAAQFTVSSLKESDAVAKIVIVTSIDTRTAFLILMSHSSNQRDLLPPHH